MVALEVLGLCVLCSFGVLRQCCVVGFPVWESPHRRRVVLYLKCRFWSNLYTIRILFQIAPRDLSYPNLTNIKENSLEKTPSSLHQHLLNAHASSSQPSPSLTQPKVPRPSILPYLIHKPKPLPIHPLRHIRSPQKEPSTQSL